MSCRRDICCCLGWCRGRRWRRASGSLDRCRAGCGGGRRGVGSSLSGCRRLSWGRGAGGCRGGQRAAEGAAIKVIQNNGAAAGAQANLPGPPHIEPGIFGQKYIGHDRDAIEIHRDRMIGLHPRAQNIARIHRHIAPVKWRPVGQPRVKAIDYELWAGAFAVGDADHAASTAAAAGF